MKNDDASLLSKEVRYAVSHATTVDIVNLFRQLSGNTNFERSAHTTRRDHMKAVLRIDINKAAINIATIRSDR